MKEKKYSIALLSLCLCLVTSMAFAVQCPKGSAKSSCGPCDTQLTPEQQKQVDEISQKYSGQLEDLRSAMFVKHSVLEAMINGGDANESKMSKIVAEMKALRQQMSELRQKAAGELEALGLSSSCLHGFDCQSHGQCKRKCKAARAKGGSHESHSGGCNQ